MTRVMNAFNLATLLPEHCAAFHLITNEPIIIIRGVSGYTPSPGLDVVEYNRAHKATAPQVEAMLTGSMFGWHVAGCDPSTRNGETAKDWV